MSFLGIKENKTLKDSNKRFVIHGTAYGKASEGRANEESMLDDIYTAVTIANNWQKYGNV